LFFDGCGGKAGGHSFCSVAVATVAEVQAPSSLLLANKNMDNIESRLVKVELGMDKIESRLVKVELTMLTKEDGKAMEKRSDAKMEAMEKRSDTRTAISVCFAALLFASSFYVTEQQRKEDMKVRLLSEAQAAVARKEDKVTMNKNFFITTAVAVFVPILMPILMAMMKAK